MKRLAKMLALTCFAALALAAVSAAGASASTFTASAKGELKGSQTTEQVFTVASGSKDKVTCKKATTTGEVVSLASPEQHVTVHYEECTAFLSILNATVPAEVTTATYLFTSDGTVHVLNTIVIHIPSAGCTIEVGPQTLGGITYTNEASGSMIVAANSTGIVSTSTGVCPHGTTGTYTGSNTVTGPGTIIWDA